MDDSLAGLFDETSDRLVALCRNPTTRQTPDGILEASGWQSECIVADSFRADAMLLVDEIVTRV
jgi:hypothetical protein